MRKITFKELEIGDIVKWEGYEGYYIGEVLKKPTNILQLRAIRKTSGHRDGFMWIDDGKFKLMGRKGLLEKEETFYAKNKSMIKASLRKI